MGIPVVDVPALLSDKFLQSKEFGLKAPQFQFIFRVWDIPVVQRKRLRTVQSVQKIGDSTVLVQFWEGAVVMPVVLQRQAPGCIQCGSSGVPQLRCSGSRCGGLGEEGGV